MKVATSMQVLSQRSQDVVGMREGHDTDRDHRVIIIEVGEDPSHRTRGRRGESKEYEQTM